jgi:ATP/maltotriose-dependent transcriptional regulator MalT/two-component SAPR family response regulator
MAVKHAHIAKITAPKISGALPRKRLFQQLDSSRKKPIIWISAPAGSGKTTLIASYLESRKLPCIWYQCDEGDSDIATFFYYMGLAAKEANPRHRKPLPFLTPEYLMDLSTFTLRYFENLSSRLKPPFVIVLDNYQEVPEQAGFHDMIVNGLEAVPHGINIIILSRGESPAQFVRLRANDCIAQFGWKDIKLTYEESRGVVQKRVKKKMAENILQQLYSKSQGWAAGLILFTERYNAGETDLHFLNESYPLEGVFEYFAGEVFSRIDRDMQDFLMKTSFLPWMTPHTAESISGNKHAAKILSELNRRSCFTEKRTLPEIAYQYHPLFREFLISKAENLFASEDILALRRKTAMLLEASGQIEASAMLYIKTKDIDGLIRLILSNAQSMIAKGRNRMLEEWLIHIPDEVLEKAPWLFYWKGVCRAPFNPSESRSFFERAFNLFQSQDDTTGTFMAWSGIVDTYIYEWSDFKSIDHWIDWLKKHVGSKPSFPSLEIEACVSSSMVGGLMFRQPHDPDIHIWIDRAISILHKSGDVDLRFRTYMYIAFYYTWVGDQARSLHEIGKLRKMADSPDASPLIMVTYMFLNAGTNIWFMAEPDISIKTVSSALDTAEKTGVHIWDDILFAIGVYGAIMKGDYDMADDFLHRMESNLIPARSYGFCQYHYLSAWYNLLLNRKEIALTHAGKALDIALKTGYIFPIALCRHEMAQILFKNGEYEKADVQLEHAKKIALDTKSLVLQFVFSLAEAQFAINRGMEKKGLVRLTKALRLGAEQGYVSLMWWWQPEVMTQLCAKALAAGIEIGYVQNLIRKHNLIPDTISMETDRWPYPIKIHTLGKFEIAKDDKPLVFSGKVQKKPLEMLKALIAFGGNSVSEAQLTDALWPDADGDLAHRSFDTTLHRLRKLLGNNRAIQLQDGQLTLDRRYCYVDAWAFELIVEQAGTLWKESKAGKDVITEAVRLSEKAIGMYKGLFLPADIMQSWAISKREHLRNKFLRLVMRTGHGLEQAGRLENAIECFRKGLETDEMAEEFYQYLMLCYQRLGLKSEAVKIYNHCRAMLSARLGISPSSRTEEIYKGIMQSTYPHEV